MSLINRYPEEELVKAKKFLSRHFPKMKFQVEFEDSTIFHVVEFEKQEVRVIFYLEQKNIKYTITIDSSCSMDDIDNEKLNLVSIPIIVN